MKTKEQLISELTNYDFAMFCAEKDLSYAQTKNEIKKANNRINSINKEIKRIRFDLEFFA